MKKAHYWLEVVSNGVSTEYAYDNQLELFSNIQKHEGKEIYFGGPNNTLYRYIAIQKILNGDKKVDIKEIRSDIHAQFA
jgi:hypothetical protein